MPKNGEIKIRRGSSGLSEFVERPVPTDDEVEAFDQYVADQAKAEEVKDSLAKIYQDDLGNKVDVRKLIRQPNRGWFFNLVAFLAVVLVLGGAVYASYKYIYLKISSQSSVSLSFAAKQEVAAGEEFFYNLNYKNEEKTQIDNIEIMVKYPENFIFLAAEPKPTKNNDTWSLPGLASRRSHGIKIKGKLVGLLDSNNIILADITYKPQNFSSEFKKSASYETKINDLGLDLSFINSTSALVNQENEIMVKFKAKDLNYLNNFRLNLEHPAEVEIIKPALATTTAPTILADGDAAWLIGNFGKNENEFKLKFKVKEKKQPQAEIKLKFSSPQPRPDENQPADYYVFYEKIIVYDVIKSDLNINLIINGSALDQGVDFGQTLNYSISYKNLGDSAMKDVIIMAALESDFLDWQSLSDKNNGITSGNAISWSKQEIPALADLPARGEGVIDFSIKVKPLSALDLSKTYQVKSQVNYSLAGKSVAGESQSNGITNKINSDLVLKEQVRYFNDDNIAVGSGPLPPKAGQTTSLKVYWTINNNLHDLNNLQINVNLPANVSWGEKNFASVGSINYDNQNNQVVWQIGHLPVTAYQASAEFSLDLTPKESDRNKIMIILPGTNITASDSVTNMRINKTLRAQTTKLEDDNIANTDGIVE